MDQHRPRPLSPGHTIEPGWVAIERTLLDDAVARLTAVADLALPPRGRHLGLTQGQRLEAIGLLTKQAIAELGAVLRELAA